MYNEDGNWVNSESKVEEVAVKYFTDLFHTSSPEEFDSFLEEVPTSITEMQNTKLMAKATEEEVKTTLFMMHT